MSEKPETVGADGGEGGATGNSEGGTTMAVQKKRLRRVSFAEMTSVHFFDRDEDNETPVDGAGAKGSERGKSSEEREEKTDLLGFRELLDSGGEDEEGDREHGDGDSDDEEPALVRRSFLRPADSPSPGSTIGSASATSNDEDDFFGPVSASFIRPGHLSDSATSNDNHDVTMDSTAFSMHFRSLARSDSGVELKTPTALRLSFEEKTPTHTNAGSFMELTIPKKPIPELSSPAENSGSSDMSLVGEKSSKYDYGRISPGLDALLAEGLHATSASDVTVASKSLQDLQSKIFPSNENRTGLTDLIHNGKSVSSLDSRFGEANGGFSTSPFSHSANAFSSNTSKPLASDILIDYSNSYLNYLSEAGISPSKLPDKFGTEDKYIQHESPLVELIPSSAKGRQIVATSTSPIQYMSLMTPQEQRGSLVCNENVKHSENASSVQKSILKLKLLEASPFSSYLTAKMENSIVGALDFSSHSPFSNSSVRMISHLQMQRSDERATATEGQSVDAFRTQEVLCASSTDDKQIEDPVDGGHMLLSEECTAAAASPSEFRWSRQKTKQDLFKSRSPSKKELVSVGSGTDPTLAEIDHVGEMIVISTPSKFVPSPDKNSESKWMSTKTQDQLSSDFNLHNQMRLKSSFRGHESASKVDATGVSKPTVSLDKLNLFSLGRKIQPSSPLVAFNNSNLIEVSHHNQQSTSEIIESLRIPIEAKQSPSISRKELEWGPQTGMEFPSLEGDHPVEKSESAVPNTRSNDLKQEKDLAGGFTKSPSSKEVQISNANANASVSDVEDVPSPSYSRWNSLSRKRSNELVILEERNHTNAFSACQRSPKLQKVENCDPRTLERPNEDLAKTSAVACELKHWTDIYSKFLKDSEQLLSPPTDKLNHSAIELLEDILFNLQRSKTYSILQSEIFTQKTSVIDDLHHQRVSEARSLLHRIIHEKVKSNLICVKRQNLQKKAELLRSGCEEAQTLKLKLMHGCKGVVKANASGLQTSVNSRHREVATDKVITMKHTLEALEKKTTDLIKSLTRSCNIEEEPSCADSVTLFTNHLMKKSCSRFIRLDMQMWIIDDVRSKNGHRDILLNYLDLIIQSLRVPPPPASSMVISYKLKDINIMKIFPDMDACAAFSFVFNAETTRKFSGSKILAQEIQVTSSLLGNLVDVVQEVHLARIELRHLDQTTFHCQRVEQLCLQLGFFSFESGEKVTLTLDLSCLKGGIYPSEILPLQITVVHWGKSSPASPLLDEIKDAIKNLRAGYTRILRLCRRVAQVIQVSRKQ